ncbi:hypothetical protein HDN1F_01610 [gamma proteobacterium HdN1]|nr:hypothetical protein HDN1F_01610 [gamma proteobacterium HdN1]
MSAVNVNLVSNATSSKAASSKAASSKAILGAALLGLALTGCGGGGGSSSGGDAGMTGSTQTGNSTNQIREGRFLDAAVSNARYVTLTPDGKVSMSGFTAEDGSFFFRDGETVSFFIGDILLGKAAAAGIVTPSALVDGANSSDALPNMLRFLQTLDTDADPYNGIQISQLVHEHSTNLKVDFDRLKGDFEVQSALTGLLAMATNSPTMPTVFAALDHFRTTMLNAYDSNSGETVLNLVGTKWRSTFSSEACGDTSVELTHTFNKLGHFTTGYHDLKQRDDGSCKGSSLAVLMALYENDDMFSCANGCSLTDLNRTVRINGPEAHDATIVHAPGTSTITIIHQYDDGREVLETMKKV